MSTDLPLPEIAAKPQRGSWTKSLRLWFDSGATSTESASSTRIDWVRALPFIGLHAGCLLLPWVGVSATAVAVAVLLYVARMFAITAFYHRYFSHRSFKTSRAAQFLFALLGASSVQRGPLWWAAQHRHHHRHADTSQDLHSPTSHGLIWSHVGWFLTPRALTTERNRIRDLNSYPELRWLDRFDAVVPLVLAMSLYAAGAWMERWAPGLNCDGPQLLVWGFFLSTVVLFHATVTINSLAHRYGQRPFETRDHSRNNLWLALLTFGEGWHNNHHFYPGAARQGFRPWEIDITWYGLRVLAALGVIWDLRPVPAWVLAQRR